MNTALKPNNEELRRIAAEVLLTRRLKRSFIPIDEKREIDSSFITCAEYQLFLDDMRVKDEYYQPYHWAGIRFPKGKAKQPITGIQAHDAIKFCEWLTQKKGVRYRLPEKDEVDGISDHSSEIATWSNDRRLIGLSSEIVAKYRKQVSELSELPLSSSIIDNLIIISPFGFYIYYTVTDALDLDLVRAGVHSLYPALAFRRARRLASILISAPSPSPSRPFGPLPFPPPPLTFPPPPPLHMIIEAFIRDCFNTFKLRNGKIPIPPPPGTSPWYYHDVRSLTSHTAFLQARDHAYSFYLDRASVSSFVGIEQIRDNIKSHNFSEAIELLQKTLETPLPEAHKRQVVVLYDAVRAAQAETFSEWRYRYCQLALRISKYAFTCIGSQPIKSRFWQRWWTIFVLMIYVFFGDQSNKPRWWKRWLQQWTTSELTILSENEKGYILQYYWFFRILQAREEGKLPAWEGIRLVRERG